MSTTSTGRPNGTNATDHTNGSDETNDTGRVDDDAASDGLIERQLDQLMPKPSSHLWRWTVATTVFAVVVTVGVLWTSGRIVPNPFAGGSWSAGGAFIVNADGTNVETRVLIPNYSDRTVRLTAIDIQGTGLEVTEVNARHERFRYIEGGCQTSADGNSEICEIQMEDGQPALTAALSLPISIRPGDDADMTIIFTVSECQAELATNWGKIRATFDFGDDAFPPFTRSYALDDPLIEEGSNSSVSLAADTTRDDRNQFNVTGPIELRDTLCAVTQAGG